MLASSSRRETGPEKSRQPKKVGCMSGLFYFLHLHRHQSRKRLPSGKREKKPPICPAPSTPEPKPVELSGSKSNPHNKRSARPDEVVAPPAAAVSCSPGGPSRRLSCDGPRSPTLPSEIRRSNSARSGTPRRQPALVARLMGLDDPPASDAPESAAEKRRKLLGALERCDEDLMALKKIIEALRVTESRRAMAARTLAAADSGPAAAKRSDNCESRAEEKRCLEVDGEQPSPVSVLDALPSPPARRRSNGSAMARGNQGGPAALAGRLKQLPRPIVAPTSEPGRHDKDSCRVVNGLQPPFYRSADIGALPKGGRTARHQFLDSGPRPKGTILSCPWRRLPCSRAMEESVDQVWEDGVWEERWELGRVGMALEGDILEDLVGEVVKELGFRRCRMVLPFDACRKRLCF